ncbi:MAG: site-specific integrase [Acidobacteria bacterium]|nr:site-specific integrase [Acidobacteriota bacterium]
MRLYKRDQIWWTDFSVNGQRFRISLDTTDGRKAPGIAHEKVAQAQQGKLSQASQSFARLAFGEAADRYIAGRGIELAQSSLMKEKQLLVKPREFFQATALSRISADGILEYREWRAAQNIGPAMLNMEVGVLRRILKRAKLWHTIADDIKPLKEPQTIGRALSPDQRQKLIGTASLKPEWETAYLAAILALNTTTRGCELRRFRWADVDLLNGTITIRKSKTVAGERVIPLTKDAQDALVRLRRRAETVGPVEPLHFIFASFKPVGKFENKEMVGIYMSGFDPTHPIGSWKKAWRTLTTKAGLKGLRFHDLRHHAITELAESGASEQTILSIAGHVSRRMQERYSHIRMEAKRNALEAISQSGIGNGTVNGTKKGGEVPDVSILGKKMVGAWGFEPQTPTVSR